MNSAIKKISTCRVCNSSNLTHLFSLGEQYISDFPPEEKVGTGIKCSISLCLCNQCTLVQQEYTAPQDFMYTRHYWYRSGTTETMRRALAEIVDKAMDCVKLEPGDTVLDIGSNDGTLLRQYPKDLAVFTVGFEPAKNLFEEGRKGISVLINDFWDASFFKDSKPKIITAIGMFYDLDDPNKFIADIAEALHHNGVFVAQLMCLKQTVEKGDIGNLAHEHLEFYSLKSLATLFENHGLRIQHIEENDINGGSYRLFVRHASTYPTQDMDVRSYFINEWDLNLDKPETYKKWFAKAEEDKKKIQDYVYNLRQDNKRIMIYGASTKGNVLLQYYDIGQHMYAAVDKSSEKVGKFTCDGVRIISEVTARVQGCDYYFVLPYAFIEEFIKREDTFLKEGGRFIVPLPNPYTIEYNGTEIVRKPL